MANGSVRKRGKKWYYRFYVEDESGRRVQREFAGSESKSETLSRLRRAMEDYSAMGFVARAANPTVGEMLDMWIEEEIKPGALSNGTVTAYLGAVNRIKKHPLGNRRLKAVTPDHLQAFLDFMSFGGVDAAGNISPPVSKGYMMQLSAVLHGAFGFAVSSKRLTSFDPMQHVRIRAKKEESELFPEQESAPAAALVITHRQYLRLTDYLESSSSATLLAVQIAYYTGMRLGEVCALSWQDINLGEQYLTVRRSMRYNGARHKTEINATKRGKARVVDFCDTLAAILKTALKAQQISRAGCERYCRNYYKPVREEERSYFEVYSLPGTLPPPEDYREIAFVCLGSDGSFTPPNTVSRSCRKARSVVEGLEGFHFHMLRHTFTSNLLSAGASPKEVQELLGHSDVNTTMNIYAHATREAKRSSARLLDEMSNGEQDG